MVAFCQGNGWYPTPERVALLERENDCVLTAENGRKDIPFWLRPRRCVGSLFGPRANLEEERRAQPDKVV